MDIREMTIEELRELIGRRDENAHKGNFGHVLLICGSRGMTGAAVLCAKAALRSGAGLVTVALPGELFPIIHTAVPEAMCIDSSADIPFEKFDAIAIGCGMGSSEETYRLVEHVLLSYHGPVIVDADGINSLCAYGNAPTGASYMDSNPLDELGIPRKRTSILPDIAMKRKAPVVLTPHPGEAARLMESLECGKYGEKSREDNAITLAEKIGAIIVLKGHETLIAAANTNAAGASPSMTDADVYINRTGNPGMATGGSGDVLTGVIASMLAAASASAARQAASMTPMSCVRAAVYVHGRAGDIAENRLGEIGMTSMDIVESLPEAFMEITGE